MSDQYMKTLFEVYVSNYELPSGCVVDGIGDLEWTIDKFFKYGAHDSDIMEFLHELWDGEIGDWNFTLADPFTISISIRTQEEQS